MIKSHPKFRNHDSEEGSVGAGNVGFIWTLYDQFGWFYI